MSDVEADHKIIFTQSISLDEIDDILDEIEEKEEMPKMEQDDQKDQRIIFEALGRMRVRGVTDTKKFTWKLVFNENKNEYENDKNDEKNNKKEKEKEIQKEERLSQLIDINYKEMCKKGHGGKYNWKDSNHKCISCEGEKEIKYCTDCEWYAKGKGITPNVSNYCYCFDCRIRNGERIRERMQLSNYKAVIIRKELLNNPCLERDLICDMGRRKAAEWVVEDINKLPYDYRMRWCLLVMDLDYFNTWNSCLGHGKTDELIRKIGGIIKSNINDINKGEWINEYGKGWQQGFSYRAGGDKFVAAIKCGGVPASFCPLGPFYSKMRDEINELGKGVKDLLFLNSNAEWEGVKEKLEAAKDREGNKINMKVVGISTGIYMAGEDVKESDWLEKADKIALEHAKEIHKPKKNGVSIYWEDIGGLINDTKVGKCLEKGMYKGNE